MKQIIYALTILSIFYIGQSPAQDTFAQFLDSLQALPDSLRTQAVSNYLGQQEHIPITEDTLAHFVFNQKVSSASIAGDFNGWDPSLGKMTRVSGTNFWYRTESFPSDARLDYKIVYNGSVWILDPRNPYRVPGGYGDNSELRMPDYVPPTEIEYRSEIPHGQVNSMQFYSEALQNSREIRIYFPHDYFYTQKEYGLVIVHDGLEYLFFAKINNTLDYLIWQKRIQPLLAVFVPPVNRSPEYIDQDQDKFTEFIVNELLPYLEAHYRIKTGPQNRATIGSSAGGNISLWLALKHPEIFGKVAAFSPYIEEDIRNGFQNSNRLDLKIYMLKGTFDHISLIHSTIAAFLPILQEKGYPFVYEEYPEGHSYGLWRAHIDDALIYLFPDSTTGIERIQTRSVQSFSLLPGFPNPFNGEITIPIELKTLQQVQLSIADINGRQVCTLFQGTLTAGRHQFKWNALNFKQQPVSSGIYFVTLRNENGQQSRQKVLLIR